MTTTDKLRAALQAVEPGWQAVDAEALRKRARRVRTRRRIAGAVAVAAVVTVVVGAAPHVFPHADGGSGAASFGMVPDTIAEAMAVAELEPPKDGPPTVHAPGKTVVGAFVPFVTFRLMPSDLGAGRVCDSYDLQACKPIERSEDGWATKGAIGTVASDSPAVAAMYWVAEAPVARVLATARGRSTPTEVADLGQGYVLVSVRLPVTRDARGIAEPLDPDAIWAFDPAGRLVARHRA